MTPLSYRALTTRAVYVKSCMTYNIHICTESRENKLGSMRRSLLRASWRFWEPHQNSTEDRHTILETLLTLDKTTVNDSQILQFSSYKTDVLRQLSVNYRGLPLTTDLLPTTCSRRHGDLCVSTIHCTRPQLASPFVGLKNTHDV